MKNPISKLAAQKVHLIQVAVACTEASSFERTEALNLIYEATDGRAYPLRPAAFTRLLLRVLEAGKRVDSKDFTPVIVNLTPHPANAEQEAAGVFDLGGEEVYTLKALLTFDSLPTPEEIEQRADQIAALAVGTGASIALIGGAPYLMSALERALKASGIRPVYAFTERISTEEDEVKTSTFRHAGFVGGGAGK